MDSLKSKLLELLKKPAAWITAVVIFVGLYIEILRGQKKKLEADAETAESKKKDAVLAQQQEDLKLQHADAITTLEAEKGRKLSDAELNDFLNKI